MRRSYWLWPAPRTARVLGFNDAMPVLKCLLDMHVVPRNVGSKDQESPSGCDITTQLGSGTLQDIQGLE